MFHYKAELIPGLSFCPMTDYFMVSGNTFNSLKILWDTEHSLGAFTQNILYSGNFRNATFKVKATLLAQFFKIKGPTPSVFLNFRCITVFAKLRITEVMIANNGLFEEVMS